MIFSNLFVFLVNFPIFGEVSFGSQEFGNQEFGHQVYYDQELFYLGIKLRFFQTIHHLMKLVNKLNKIAYFFFLLDYY